MGLCSDMQVDAGSPAGFILHENAQISLYPAQNAAKSTGGHDLAQYAPASHAGDRGSSPIGVAK